MTQLKWRLIPFFIFLILALLFWRGLELDPRRLPSVKIDQPLPTFELDSLDGKPFSPALMKGHASLLNVWASWCMACVEEQGVLMQLAKEGVLIYGLNYKDTPEHAKEWLGEWGNPFQHIGEDVDGKVAIDMGVYGAPETFLIDKNGVIRYRHVGALTLSIWKNEFLPRFELLERTT